jgi:hypothetical protein
MTEVYDIIGTARHVFLIGCSHGVACGCRLAQMAAVRASVGSWDPPERARRSR